LKRIGVLPAAGKGLRFKELGKQYPKAVLPINGVPIIVENIQWMKNNGCDEIIVVVNHRSDKIIEIVNMFFNDIKFKYQEKQIGLSSAIYDGIKDIEHDAEFLIVLGDLKVKESSLDFTESFVGYSEVEDYSRWCMVKGKRGENIQEIFDKPSEKPNTNLALSGVYFFKNLNLKEDLRQQIDLYEKEELQISWFIERHKDEILLKEVDVVDFGTLEEYLKNKDISMSRSFNDMEVSNRSITKKSKNVSKLIQEYNWYQNIPTDLKPITPMIIDKNFFSEVPYYTMERVLSTTAREIFLYLDNVPETWENVFSVLFGVLDDMNSFISPERPNFMKNMYKKTKQRIDDIEIPIENKIVNEFLEEFESNIEIFENEEVVIHGDFCFSNILYDMQLDSVKLIDPRGEIFGSKYYDVAKLLHSVVGEYDIIDAELYVKNGDSYSLFNDGKEKIKEIFIKNLRERYSQSQICYIYLVTASLFISMIPLHSHNKDNQKLFYEQFKKMYSKYKELKELHE